VVLNLANDQASASFYAVQPEVRQAIESAFPRLREMMNEAGIQLDQATVFAEASPQQRDEAANPPGRRHAQRLGADDETPPQQAAGTIPLRTGRGLIDTFA
jgi:flagellar hook-length control protein FliK